MTDEKTPCAFCGDPCLGTDCDRCANAIKSFGDLSREDFSSCHTCGRAIHLINTLCINCGEIESRLKNYLKTAKGREFARKALTEAREKAGEDFTMQDALNAVGGFIERLEGILPPAPVQQQPRHQPKGPRYDAD